jgi:hypothetical protein
MFAIGPEFDVDRWYLSGAILFVATVADTVAGTGLDRLVLS